MNDITQHFRFQRILVEAANWRTMCALLDSDPDLRPNIAALIREIRKRDCDDPRALREIAER
jgi:hypothetical protein